MTRNAETSGNHQPAKPDNERGPRNFHREPHCVLSRSVPEDDLESGRRSGVLGQDAMGGAGVVHSSPQGYPQGACPAQAVSAKVFPPATWAGVIHRPFPLPVACLLWLQSAAIREGEACSAG